MVDLGNFKPFLAQLRPFSSAVLILFSLVQHPFVLPFVNKAQTVTTGPEVVFLPGESSCDPYMTGLELGKFDLHRQFYRSVYHYVAGNVFKMFQSLLF